MRRPQAKPIQVRLEPHEQAVAVEVPSREQVQLGRSGNDGPYECTGRPGPDDQALGGVLRHGQVEAPVVIEVGNADALWLRRRPERRCNGEAARAVAEHDDDRAAVLPVQIKSGLPSRLMSAAVRPRGLRAAPLEMSRRMNRPSPRPRRIERLLLSALATARSGMPSRLKSPVVMSKAPAPIETLVAGAKPCP